MSAPKPTDRDVIPEAIDAKSALLRDSEALQASLARVRPEDLTQEENDEMCACLRELSAFLRFAGRA